MIFDYIPGKCLTGTERRAGELNYALLNPGVGMELCPGTFNIQLDSPLPFDRLQPPLRIDRYSLYICGVGVGEGQPVPGWILRIDGEGLPDHFVEVVSVFNIRERLKLQNWASAKVKLALQLGIDR